ncbi:hypothetical protein EYF80_020781 [Liparis tanakae]|uniref:Uncharacterized protein n=1 Tax=Liparis tanakae TaxID=230148 RepID=A0A4Z2HTE1_9TELE|nr:hypothetical protein EYF80_020781 [Liparis tanakae]
MGGLEGSTGGTDTYEGGAVRLTFGFRGKQTWRKRDICGVALSSSLVVHVATKAAMRVGGRDRQTAAARRAAHHMERVLVAAFTAKQRGHR